MILYKPSPPPKKVHKSIQGEKKDKPNQHKQVHYVAKQKPDENSEDSTFKNYSDVVKANEEAPRANTIDEEPQEKSFKGRGAQSHYTSGEDTLQSDQMSHQSVESKQMMRKRYSTSRSS